MRFVFYFFFLVSNLSFALDSSLNIMFYNVENLFDTLHDEGKDDWSFLPDSKEKIKECKKKKSLYQRQECLKTNWGRDKLEIKLSHIQKVITLKRSVIPDFLGLSEVENENVVQMLAKKCGYNGMVVASGPDKRGVDVALLYNKNKRIIYQGHKEHELSGDYFKRKPTRTILEVNFLVDEKQPLSFLVNHWPSQFNPARTRMIAAQKVMEIVNDKLKKNSKHAVIVMGDFNTIPNDHPHPFDEVLLSKGILWDLHARYVSSKQISKEEKSAMPSGTYFYYKDMTWNLLDRFFLSKNLFNTSQKLRVVLKKYQIYTPDFIKEDFVFTKPGYRRGSVVKGIPKSYNFEENKEKDAGYSDHFPIMFSLNY